MMTTYNPQDLQPLEGFLFYPLSKANRIETMVDKYTKHSILNAVQRKQEHWYRR